MHFYGPIGQDSTVGDATGIGKFLLIAGLGMAGLGLLMMAGSRIPWLRLFSLPGDVRVERDNFTFFFPITSMLLLSALLTLILWIAGWLRR